MKNLIGNIAKQAINKLEQALPPSKEIKNFKLLSYENLEKQPQILTVDLASHKPIEMRLTAKNGKFYFEAVDKKAASQYATPQEIKNNGHFGNEAFPYLRFKLVPKVGLVITNPLSHDIKITNELDLTLNKNESYFECTSGPEIKFPAVYENWEYLRSWTEYLENKFQIRLSPTVRILPDGKIKIVDPDIIGISRSNINYVEPNTTIYTPPLNQPIQAQPKLPLPPVANQSVQINPIVPNLKQTVGLNQAINLGEKLNFGEKTANGDIRNLELNELPITINLGSNKVNIFKNPNTDEISLTYADPQNPVNLKLLPGNYTTIGRDSAFKIGNPNDLTLSRQHLQVQFTENNGKFYLIIKDTSTNGTTYEKFTSKAIQPKQTIQNFTRSGNKNQVNLPNQILQSTPDPLEKFSTPESKKVMGEFLEFFKANKVELGSGIGVDYFIYLNFYNKYNAPILAVDELASKEKEFEKDSKFLISKFSTSGQVFNDERIVSFNYFRITDKFGNYNINYSPENLGRIYINFSPNELVKNIKLVIEELKNANISVDIKYPRTYVNALNRSDNCVIYFDYKNSEKITSILASVKQKMGGSLRHDIPKFTKEFSTGIGFGQEPFRTSQPESFGTIRAKILAKLIELAGKSGLEINDPKFDLHGNYVRLCQKYKIDPENPAFNKNFTSSNNIVSFSRFRHK